MHFFLLTLFTFTNSVDCDFSWRRCGLFVVIFNISNKLILLNNNINYVNTKSFGHENILML